MTKYFILFTSIVFLTGCDSFTSTIETTETTNYDYVDFIPNDTTANTNVAEVPHTKSSIPMLAILISYDNIEITSSDSTWSSKLFGTNEHQLNHYFKEVSNSNFQITKAIESDGTVNDGIVSIQLNTQHPENDSEAYIGLAQALREVDNKIDFSNYDSNANGFISPEELLLTFIIAGYEDSYEGYHVTNGIWAHVFCMTSSSNIPILDGVSLMSCSNDGNFAVFGELHDRRDPHDATIGIIAHELGHSAFALPDLYNTRYTNGGIGYFGLMGAGGWTTKNSSEFPGNTPVHFSAWSKVYNGWVTPQEVTGTTSLLTTSSDSYNVLKIPISANQYYLLENRDNSGYDRGFYLLDGNFDGGMAIWHINENKLTESDFYANSVNADTSDKGVDLIEAANATIDSGGLGDEKALFYYPNIDAFGTKVTDISSRSSSMTLNIN